MGKYIIRRLLIQIPVLIGVSILLFSIFKLAPGNPLAHLYMDPNMTAADVEAMAVRMGLDKPGYQQYFDYMKQLVIHRNMGMSVQLKRPVAQMIGERMWNTFYLAFLGLIINLIIAIPIGVISATKQYSKFDYFFTVLALVGISIPSFFLGLLAMKTFAVDLRWLPTSGMQTPGNRFVFPQNVLDIMKHSVLPGTILGITGAAGFMRYTRSSMLEVVRQDYIRTARAKGLKERTVIYKHALRNALIPVITILGFSLPALFSGALMTEIVFNWPGMGRMQYRAVNDRDYGLLMGINLFLAVLTITGNLLADISYAFVDPRIRYD